MGNIIKSNHQTIKEPLATEQSIANQEHRSAEKSIVNSRRQTLNHSAPSVIESISESSTNPFLIFFLRLSKLQPGIHVSKLARVAGRRWRNMTPTEREKYVRLAAAERRRREKRVSKRKRKIKSTKVHKRKKGFKTQV